MHKCEYCERELKSNAGKVRHEKSCKVNVESPEDEIHVDDIFVMEKDADGNPTGMATLVRDKVVQLEILGGEETYYDGHPRRLIKLKGLLSRTHDRKERIKVHNLILELM